jgi:hypothetical protein
MLVSLNVLKQEYEIYTTFQWLYGLIIQQKRHCIGSKVAKKSTATYSTVMDSKMNRTACHQ